MCVNAGVAYTMYMHICTVHCMCVSIYMYMYVCVCVCVFTIHHVLGILLQSTYWCIHVYYSEPKNIHVHVHVYT